MVGEVNVVQGRRNAGLFGPGDVQSAYKQVRLFL